MTEALNGSHNPELVSWVASANDHSEFPIQNLPYGVCSSGIVVAIGKMVLPLRKALDAGWGASLGEAINALRADTLNPLMLLPPDRWHAVRMALSEGLSDPAWQSRLEPLLHEADEVRLVMPFHCGDYTDFYASIHHATNVGSMFRPDNPLLPNYKWIPIGYHGRASTIVCNHPDIVRPNGQTRPDDGQTPPFGPCRMLDYELELGIVVGGQNGIGTTVPAAESASRIFGVVLLNDWSARDMQAWEYQPLGPFLAKSFVSTVSPWVVTSEALRPYRVGMAPRPDSDPQPLSYLQVPNDSIWALELGVELTTVQMRSRGDKPFRISQSRFDEAMYWSPAQLVTHHASNGCALNAGDLLGTGTISGTAPESRGCLLERTWRGAEPLGLPDGAERKFLEDGDEVVFKGHAVAAGYPKIGFGVCAGRVISE